VGTPGRVLWLLQQKILPASNIRAFIMDEADKILDENFLPEVRKVVASLPEKKQVHGLHGAHVVHAVLCM
jgi:ATP-dependent RNA helicase RhlE